VSSSKIESRPRLAILISGGGTNMLAIARACAAGQIHASVAVVIADVPEAPGVARARALGLPTAVVDRRARLQQHRGDDPAGFEAAQEQELLVSGADTIILAGFMHVLSAGFVGRHAGRILNIHPSLLPHYKGLDTHARVLEAGETAHGVTVHFVTAELDGGPLIAQSTVPIAPGDTVTSLSARVHEREYILYPMVIDWLATGRLRWNDGQPTLDGKPLREPVQVA
jgi:phosphoribosylglycinamide formyltransferase-1